MIIIILEPIAKNMIVIENLGLVNRNHVTAHPNNLRFFQQRGQFV